MSDRQELFLKNDIEKFFSTLKPLDNVKFQPVSGKNFFATITRPLGCFVLIDTDTPDHSLPLAELALENFFLKKTIEEEKSLSETYKVQMDRQIEVFKKRHYDILQERPAKL